MIFVRWFGLDTVFCVLAVQLFLQQMMGGISSYYLLGISMATSLFYMIDRLVDARIDAEPQFFRHVLYSRYPWWMMVSCIILGSMSMYCWLQFSMPIKFRLLYGGICCVAHLALLYFRWYRCIKPLVVAAVFSWVMVAGLPVISMIVYGVIFGLTLLNLCVHAAIETNALWLRCACIMFWVIMVAFLVVALPNGWLVIVFGFGTLLYAPLVHYSKWLIYWYELGEFIYALPFLVACGLMI